MTAAELKELSALRILAEAVRVEEREPCGGTVHDVRAALRDVDREQGRESDWMEAS